MAWRIRKVFVRQLFEMARTNKPSIIFIDEVDSLCSSRFPLQGCGTGKQAIWIAVENARFNPSSIDHSSFSTSHDTNSQTTTTSFTTETPKECAKFCSNTTTTFFDNFGRRRRCNAFSFNENEKLCQLAYSNVEFPSMLVQTTEVDFVQRAFRRLCYGGKREFFLKKSRTRKSVKMSRPQKYFKMSRPRRYYKMSSPRKCCKTSRPQKITQRPDPAKFKNAQNSINIPSFLANFSPFSGCSDFLSFMDYKLNDVAISPKELYDGLPKNIQGLSACIELCVLANDFNCLSGFFDTLKGRCLLYNVNSLSNPSAFCKHNGNGHQLYFENGCAESHKDVAE